MAGQTQGERGSALSKALDVLRIIAESERAVGLAELAEQLELPRPTLHRVLQQLVEEQLILRAAQKDRYVVGPKLTQLVGKCLAQFRLASTRACNLERTRFRNSRDLQCWCLGPGRGGLH